MYLRKIVSLTIYTIFCISTALADNFSYSDLLEHNSEYSEAIRLGIASITPNCSIQKNLSFETLNGGFTATKLFTFIVDGKKYVLRLLPKKSKPDSRANEIKAIKIANQLGIAPELKFSDPGSMIVITPYIQGHTLTKNDLKNPKIIQTLAKMIKTLHEYSGDFPQNRNQNDRASKHYERGLNKHIAYPSDFKKLYDQYIEEGKKPQAAMVLCHGDLNPSNIIVTDNRIYIIDWSSTTKDNPYTDLGYLTLLSDMNTKQSKIFLDAYFKRKSTKKELMSLCLAQKRVTFLTSVVWFDFSESPNEQKVDLQTRVDNLDRMLRSTHLKRGRTYLREGIFVNPKTAPTKNIRLYALGFLKDYITWRCPNN